MFEIHCDRQVECTLVFALDIHIYCNKVYNKVFCSFVLKIIFIFDQYIDVIYYKCFLNRLKVPIYRLIMNINPYREFFTSYLNLHCSL